MVHMLPNTWAAAKRKDYTVEGDAALLSAFDVGWVVFILANTGERQVPELTD